MPQDSFVLGTFGKGECRGIAMREKFANRDGISCGDVCRYVWEGQSKIDRSRAISAEGKGFMTLAALIRSAYEREKARNDRVECFTIERHSTTSLPTVPSYLFEASKIRDKINAHVLIMKRREDVKRHAQMINKAVG